MNFEEFKIFALTYLNEKDHLIGREKLENYLESLNKDFSLYFEKSENSHLAHWIQDTFTINENHTVYELVFLNIKENVFYLNLSDTITNNKILITIPLTYAINEDDDFNIQIEGFNKYKTKQMPITLSFLEMEEFNNDIKKYKDKLEFYALTTDNLFPEIENILLNNKDLIGKLCLLGKGTENKSYLFKDFIEKSQQKIKYQN